MIKELAEKLHQYAERLESMQNSGGFVPPTFRHSCGVMASNLKRTSDDFMAIAALLLTTCTKPAIDWSSVDYGVEQLPEFTREETHK